VKARTHDGTDPRPLIIQGGMGAGISDWRLARAVSSQGQLGVVSGTALDAILARRLQTGDPGGHMRRALDRFPAPPIADRIWNTYFVPGGKDAAKPFTNGRVYVNYIGAGEAPDRVRAAFGADKYEKLVAIKRKYDPMNVFRINQNIVPG